MAWWRAYFKQAKPLTISEAEFLAWFDPTFERIVAEEGAVLLMPGRTIGPRGISAQAACFDAPATSQLVRQASRQ